MNPSSSSSYDKFRSAGILPYAIAPNIAQDIYILLGKEEHVPGWKHGSNKWCDFSGGATCEDIDIETTAAREFVEESLAMVPLHKRMISKAPLEVMESYPPAIAPESGIRKSSLSFVQIEDVYQDLKERNYTHKITMMKKLPSTVHSSGAAGESSSSYKCIYYLKRIPWQPELQGQFLNLRKNYIIYDPYHKNIKNLLQSYRSIFRYQEDRLHNKIQTRKLS